MKKQIKGWSDEELCILKKHSSSHTLFQLASMLERTELSIAKKLRKENLTWKKSNNVWSLKEEMFLKQMWGKKSIEYFEKKLNRTRSSIRSKVSRLNLGTFTENLKEEISIQEISRILNISPTTIVHKWSKLGLEINLVELSKNYKVYVTDYSHFLEFLEENKNEWSAAKLEKYELGLEPDWLKEKRQKDKHTNPLKYRKWSKEEIIRIIRLKKSNHSIAEISKLVNRSEATIERLLGEKQLNDSRRWKSEQEKFLRDNYNKLTDQNLSEKLNKSIKSVQAKTKRMGLKKTNYKN